MTTRYLVSTLLRFAFRIGYRCSGESHADLSVGMPRCPASVIRAETIEVAVIGAVDAALRDREPTLGSSAAQANRKAALVLCHPAPRPELGAKFAT